MHVDREQQYLRVPARYFVQAEDSPMYCFSPSHEHNSIVELGSLKCASTSTVGNALDLLEREKFQGDDRMDFRAGQRN